MWIERGGGSDQECGMPIFLFLFLLKASLLACEKKVQIQFMNEYFILILYLWAMGVLSNMVY